MKNPFDSIEEPTPTMNNRPHPIGKGDPTLWRKHRAFNADDMISFARSMEIKILSSQGTHEISIEDLGEWARKQLTKKTII